MLHATQLADNRKGLGANETAYMSRHRRHAFLMRCWGGRSVHALFQDGAPLPSAGRVLGLAALANYCLASQPRLAWARSRLETPGQSSLCVLLTPSDRMRRW